MSEFRDLFGEWYTPVAVGVETYGGGGFDGATYAASVPVDDLMIERKQKLVRTPDGNERMSMSQLFVEPEQAAPFTLHSRVTLDGEQHSVMQIEAFDVFGLPGHRVVYLE